MDNERKTATVTFRGMRFKDLLQVQQLNMRNSTENFLLGTFLSTLSASYATSFVAELDGKIIGYSEAAVFRERKKGHIYSICVDGPFRGCGIGRRLIGLSIDAIRTEMKEKEICEIDLYVRTSNTEAIGLYKSVGFVIREKDLSYYEGGAPAHRMSLYLGTGTESRKP
ncbi:N-terminal acyltransferase complex subunit Ard1 [Encephalitozoon intestinalis ATCC 50506]|uniref:N-terminal acyltransferase complex subunit Ard1 n=1 Tax=Encephalitozoon intestinalis (strain ATCC 50506) TaxID=876142 RepID=E0S7G7_ENCIT|nr:N-terminal acyltransferase complex subunit Ard1 [Encephalitozoon intestinalis ATCC 50506]ADM11646.1 N-terminal acyltransferase complex subunit Ard1 [Encephalitozoon intestinalis ATCC 50506]UTX45380.1 N-terminal acyltransferase complex subunit Ard1 [Encephalitozoon intestinalis]